MSRTLRSKNAGAKGKFPFSVSIAVLIASVMMLAGSCGEKENNAGDYNLTVSASPAAGGTVSPSGTKGYSAGTQVAVKATANTGYKFSSWTGAPSDVDATNPSISVTMDSDLTLVANFQLDGGGTGNHSLTVSALPVIGGTVLPSGTASYATGTPVTVTANAYDGYKFSMWEAMPALPASIDVTNPSITLTINSSQTLAARFVLDGPDETHNLAVNVQPPNSGTVTPAGVTECEPGEQVAVTAKENTGYKFSHWSGSPALPSGIDPSSPNITVTVTSTVTLTANFHTVSTGGFCIWTGTGACQPLAEPDRQACETHGMVVEKCPDTPPDTGSGEFCDWGLYDPITGDGGCFPIKNAAEKTECTQYGGKVVAHKDSCVSNKDTTKIPDREFCNWPASSSGAGGCWEIKDAAERANCLENGTGIYSDYNCTVLIEEGGKGTGNQCSDSRGMLFCQWPGGCYALDPDHSTPVGTPCATLITECPNLFANVNKSYPGMGAPGHGDGVNCAAAGGTALSSGGGGGGACLHTNNLPLHCGYAPYGTGLGGCFAIDERYSDPTPTGEKTCSALIAHCTASTGTLYTGVNATYPGMEAPGHGNGVSCVTAGGTAVGGGTDPCIANPNDPSCGGGATGTFCRWGGDPTNCHPIGGPYATGGTVSEAACRADYGEVVTNCNATSNILYCMWDQCYPMLTPNDLKNDCDPMPCPAGMTFAEGCRQWSDSKTVYSDANCTIPAN